MFLLRGVQHVLKLQLKLRPSARDAKAPRPLLREHGTPTSRWDRRLFDDPVPVSLGPNATCRDTMIDPRHRTQLRTTDVQVWTARVDGLHATAEYIALLDDAERARAARFSFERDRSHYVQSHGILRLILSGYLGVEASELTFIRGRSGKPQLTRVSGQPPLEFSLSHSGDYCMVAVRLEKPLGVDLEKIRDVPQLIDIAQRYFTPGEHRLLASLAGAAQRDTFFALWTQKEAVVKALGQGLGDKLDQLAFELDAMGEPQLRSCRGSLSAACQWSVTRLSSVTGYAAAVASLHPHDLVKERAWNIAAIA